MNTPATPQFTLRVCRHARLGCYYLLVVDQDGAITDLDGPSPSRPLLTSVADRQWSDDADLLAWASRQPWHTVEERPYPHVCAVCGDKLAIEAVRLGNDGSVLCAAHIGTLA